MENAIVHLPQVWITDTTVNSLCHGANLCIPGIARLHSDISKDDPVAVLSMKGELVGLGICVMSSEEMMKSEKGVCVRIDKVFMDPATYPKYVK